MVDFSVRQSLVQVLAWLHNHLFKKPLQLAHKFFKCGLWILERPSSGTKSSEGKTVVPQHKSREQHQTMLVVIVFTSMHAQ